MHRRPVVQPPTSNGHSVQDHLPSSENPATCSFCRDHPTTPCRAHITRNSHLDHFIDFYVRLMLGIGIVICIFVATRPFVEHHLIRFAYGRDFDYATNDFVPLKTDIHQESDAPISMNIDNVNAPIYYPKSSSADDKLHDKKALPTEQTIKKIDTRQNTQTKANKDPVVINGRMKAPKGMKILKSETIDSKNDLPPLKPTTLKEPGVQTDEFVPTIMDSVKPQKIFQDGRRIPAVKLEHQTKVDSTVQVYIWDDFLSDKECEMLIKVHKKYLHILTQNDPLVCFDSFKSVRDALSHHKLSMKLSPNDFVEDTLCFNSSISDRLSKSIGDNMTSSTIFYPGESKFSLSLASRIERAMGLHRNHGGQFQITSYPPPFGRDKRMECMLQLNETRDRLATVRIFLDTVEEGGEINFPAVGIWVRPRKGRALLVTNMNSKGQCEKESEFSESPVIKGNKIVLQQSFFYENFYWLGKRVAEPKIPERAPETPRILCELGMECSWSDQWDYGHLRKYRKFNENKIKT